MQYEERQQDFRIGRSVLIPDGRSGVVRFVYPAERGLNLIVRVEDNSMLVIAASKCRMREVPRGSGGGGGGI
jgi:hypothetical protein